MAGSRLEVRAKASAQSRFVSKIFSPEATEASLGLYHRTVNASGPEILLLRFTGLPVNV